MGDWIKYRKNGGRVVSSAKEKDPSWADQDPDIFDTYDTGIPKPPVPGQWCDGVTFRAATAPEIAAWPAKLAEDEVFLDKKATKAAVSDERKWRILVKMMIDELNILRANDSLPDRTFAQFVTAWENKTDNE